MLLPPVRDLSVSCEFMDHFSVVFYLFLLNEGRV